MAVIQGDAITLRPITMDDTNDIVRWRNSEAVRPHFIFREAFTPEMHQEWMDTKVSKGEVVQFIIEYEGNPIGSTFLKDIDKGNKKAEFGLFIGEETQKGKGIGTEAISLTLQYAFHTLGLHRVVSRILERNIVSLRACENAGFRMEGFLKDDVIIDGEYRSLFWIAAMNPNK